MSSFYGAIFTLFFKRAHRLARVVQSVLTSVCKGTITGSLWVTRVNTVSVSVLFVITSVTVPRSVGAGGNISGTRSDTASGCLIVTVTTADGAFTSEGIIASKLEIPLYGLGQGNTRLGEGWWGGITLPPMDSVSGSVANVFISSKFSFEAVCELFVDCCEDKVEVKTGVWVLSVGR